MAVCFCFCLTHLAATILFPHAPLALLQCEYEYAHLNPKVPSADAAFVFHALALNSIKDYGAKLKDSHNVMRELVLEDDEFEFHPGMADFGRTLNTQLYHEDARPEVLRKAVAMHLLRDVKTCNDFAANCLSQIRYMEEKREMAEKYANDRYLRVRRSFSDNSREMLYVFVHLKRQHAGGR